MSQSSQRARPVLRKLQRLLAALGLTLVVVLLLELTARLAVFVADDVLQVGGTESAAQSRAAEGLDYDLEALLREQESLPRPSYQPYVVWRSRPYEGTYLHVDERGHRVTPTSSGDPEALRIWMLGGSTVFGYGAPDEQTIASHLARRLMEELDLPVRVENLGQGGYVSTQELIHLLRELQLREPPHAVIFYDGYNDAVAIKNWPEAPGTHFQVDRIRSRFERAFVPLIQSSALSRVLERIVQRLAPPRPPIPPEEARVLGDRAADLWLRNASLATSLGESHGFHTGFFLQPAHRHSVLEAMGESLGQRPAVHDLRDAFRGEEDRFFLDTVHLAGPGNDRIARRIAEKLVPTLRTGIRSRAEPPADPVDGAVDPE